MNRAERLKKQAETPVGPIDEWWQKHPDKLVTRGELWEIFTRYDAGYRRLHERVWYRRLWKAVWWFLMRPIFTLPKYNKGELK